MKTLLSSSFCLPMFRNSFDFLPLGKVLELGIHGIRNGFRKLAVTQSREEWQTRTPLKQRETFSFKDQIKLSSFQKELSILQQEILGKVSLRRPETAFIGCASPINLDQFSALYEADKKSGLQAVKLELAHRLTERLTSLKETKDTILSG